MTTSGNYEGGGVIVVRGESFSLEARFWTISQISHFHSGTLLMIFFVRVFEARGKMGLWAFIVVRGGGGLGQTMTPPRS